MLLTSHTGPGDLGSGPRLGQCLVVVFNCCTFIYRRVLAGRSPVGWIHRQPPHFPICAMSNVYDQDPTVRSVGCDV